MTEQEPITTASDIPDRVCVERNSEFFHPDFAKIGVKFNGEARPDDTFEFCVSEGWIKKILYMRNSKPILERGKPRTIFMRGDVATFIK